MFAKGKNKADADAYEKEMLERAGKLLGGERVTLASRRDITVEEIANRYLESPEFTRLRARSRVRVRTLIEPFLKWNEVHGRKYVKLFTPDIAAVYVEHINATREGKGRELALTYVNKIFRMEMLDEEGAIKRSPFAGKITFDKRRRRKLRVKPRAFTITEIDRIHECTTLENLRPTTQLLADKGFDPAEYLRNVWTIFLNMGLRSGEFMAMPVSSITANSWIIETQRDENNAVVSETKTGEDREVKMNAHALRATQYFLKHRDGSGFLLRRDIALSQRHFFLRSLYGIVQAMVKKYPEMAPAFDNRGKPKRARTNVHTFRKTIATWLINANTDVHTIADILGDTVDVVLDYYAAVWDDKQDDALSVMDRVQHGSYEPSAPAQRPSLPSAFTRPLPCSPDVHS